MILLNQRSEQQQSLHVSVIKENNSRYEAAIAKWEGHCAELTSKLGNAVPLSLSPAETEMRLKQSQASREARSPPVMADGAMKGGGASASANALQGALGVLA